jgi:predicted ATPase
VLVERAQTLKMHFAITNENAPAITEICYRQDGLPLAIELATARVMPLPPQTLLVHLSNSLRLVTKHEAIHYALHVELVKQHSGSVAYRGGSGADTHISASNDFGL